MRKRLFPVLLCASWQVWADAHLSDLVVDTGPSDTIEVRRHEDAAVKIDGHLTEDIWTRLPAYDEFVVIEPDTLVDGAHATRVRLFYDSSGLFFGVDMEQPAGTLIARLSGRDIRWLNRDSINITLDTSGEGRYGYWFGLNLGDSLMDGTVLPERQFSNDWDGAWRGASQVTEKGWSGEFHIPWSTMAMPSVAGKRRLGLYMSRKVAYLDERYGWPALPRTRAKFISEFQRLSVSGINPRQQFSIYPFAAVTEDRVQGGVSYRTGADFFWRPSSNFQLTATVNPDFGAVESDEVIINLSATETFFPEKRLFFLEGREIFVASPRADTRSQGIGRSGAPVTLINTRRIGGQPLAPDTASDVTLPERELRRPVDLLGAVKLTGQSGRLRYGVLAAFEDDVRFNAERGGDSFHLSGSASDYGVARLLYEDQPGGAYRALGVMSTAVINEQRDARVHGIDGHYLSRDGSLKIDGQVFTSNVEGEDRGYGGFVDFEYTFRQGVVQGLGIEYFDEHVDINDLGFQQRRDSLRIRTRHTRRSSDVSWARDNEFDIRGFVQRNRDGLFTGGGVFLANEMTFDALSRLTLRAYFIPGYYDDLNSFGNGAYRIEQDYGSVVSWASDSSKPFHFGFSAGYAREDLGGSRYTGHTNVEWRPNDRVALSVRLRYRDRDGWLLHQEDRNFTTFRAEELSPRISADYFITARQQLRFSLQWVGIRAEEDKFYRLPDTPGDLLRVAKPDGPDDSFSLSQMSMQLRYRWEIAPLSDVFLVYTRLVDESGAFKSFSSAFADGYDNPLGDFLVLKIRYRFGS